MNEIKSRHRWTNDEIEYLRVNYQIYPIPELVIKFNDHFNSSLSRKQLLSIMSHHNIRCGRSAKFVKGHTPANKGKTWDEIGLSEETKYKMRQNLFKTGHNTHNSLPVGTEIIKKGKVMIKCDTEGNSKSHKWWKYKHHIIWEEAHGPIPKDHLIVFADGNPNNFDLNNLVCVSRGEALVMNQNHFFRNDAEATKCGVALSKLILRRNQRAKK